MPGLVVYFISVLGTSDSSVARRDERPALQKHTLKTLLCRDVGVARSFSVSKFNLTKFNLSKVILSKVKM
jgi:hypothetical protein